MIGRQDRKIIGWTNAAVRTQQRGVAGSDIAGQGRLDQIV